MTRQRVLTYMPGSSFKPSGSEVVQSRTRAGRSDCFVMSNRRPDLHSEMA